MYIPTQEDIRDFEALYEEFKSYSSGKTKIEISDEVIDTLIKNTSKDDPLRKESERLKRHNKYAKMCMMYAPYFYSAILTNLKAVK